MADARRPASEADALPAPPVDKVGEDVAMARIQGALFGTSTPPTLERYALLEKLGEGSYGSVYSAWDPRLDRKVAIKVLHGGATKTLEREARALAKLAHPNVVTIHDVGESEHELFLAMEFVQGTPLSAVDTEAFGWRRVVATYRQAAAGLCAAHDAGVVHRDFKPANAVLGQDGRVRVLDFGLARTEVASPPEAGGAKQTRSAGTPRYMAPEQHRGEPVDARTDQYCFCASLWEALYGQPAFADTGLDALLKAKQSVPQPPPSRAVPGRVARILQRGLAPRPDDRFGSLHTLDVALGRALTRRTQALAGFGVATIALVAGVGLGRVDRPCVDTDRAPRRWTRDSRGALHEAFAQTALPHAARNADTATGILEDWSSTWGAARHDACMQHDKGVLSAEGLDLQTQCLDRRRGHFDALLDVFLAADPQSVNNAVKAASALPSPAACTDLQRLRTAHPIPEDTRGRIIEATTTLTRARAEVDAGHYARAAELATPVAAACHDRGLSHPPTCVEATLVLGTAAGYMGAHDRALVSLRAGAIEAQRARLPEAFARAASELTWELGEVDAAFDAGLTWSAMGQAALDGLPPSPVTLQLLNNEGCVLLSAGRWDEAAAAHHRRLEVLDEDSPQRFKSLVNLANISNRRGLSAQAEVEYTAALEVGTTTFGATHPRVLAARQNRAGLRVRVGDFAAARLDLQDVLAAQRKTLGNTHPEIAPTLVNLSIAQRSAGEGAEALRSAQEATTLVRDGYGENSQLEIDTRLAEADALTLLGRAQEAVSACERAAELTGALLGSEHSTMAFTLRAWGLALRAHGDEETAMQKLRAAKAVFLALDLKNEAALIDVD